MHYISYWKDRNHIVFMGDDKMRQLFDEFALLIRGDGSPDSLDIIDHDFIPIERKSYIQITGNHRIYENVTNSEKNEHFEETSIGLNAVGWGQSMDQFTLVHCFYAIAKTID